MCTINRASKQANATRLCSETIKTLSLVLWGFFCIVWSLKELQWFETGFFLFCFVLDVQIVYEIKMFV